MEAEGERIVHGEKLGYLPQELPEEDREKTIYEFLCEEEMFWETDPRELADIASEMGLKADFFYRDQKMQTLSGGEKVKVQMAKLLVGKPSVFLLDEPSNDIDIETLEWMEKLIQGTRQAVLFISHDETLIENTANMVIHLEQICRKTKSRYTVVHTGYRDYLESRNLNFENQRRKALNDRREEKKRQEKFNRIREKVQNDLNSVSRQDPHSGYLLKKKMRAVKSMERRFDREAEEMERLPEEEEAIFFRMKDVSFPSGKMLLEYKLDRLETPDGALLAKNLQLRVKGPEKICLMGKIGVGRTTFL